MAMGSLADSVQPGTGRAAQTYHVEHPLTLLATAHDLPLNLKLDRLDETEGFVVDRAPNLTTATRMAQDRNYDVLLIRHAPDFDGIRLCADIRQAGVDTPILMLASSSSPQVIMAGLESGADCCASDPMSFQELVARLHALHRRMQYTHSIAIPQVAGLRLDSVRHGVYRCGKSIALSEWEYGLLRYLMQHEGQVIPRRYIVSRLREDSDALGSIVDECVAGLCQKLEEAGGDSAITTVGALGYMLEHSQPDPHSMPKTEGAPH
jgi:DNA-binding response OmpR family regulator